MYYQVLLNKINIFLTKTFFPWHLKHLKEKVFKAPGAGCSAARGQGSCATIKTPPPGSSLLPPFSAEYSVGSHGTSVNYLVSGPLMQGPSHGSPGLTQTAWLLYPLSIILHSFPTPLNVWLKALKTIHGVLFRWQRGRTNQENWEEPLLFIIYAPFILLHRKYTHFLHTGEKVERLMCYNPRTGNRKKTLLFYNPCCCPLPHGRSGWPGGPPGPPGGLLLKPGHHKNHWL